MQPDFDSRGVTRPLSAFLRLAMLGLTQRNKVPVLWAEPGAEPGGAQLNQTRTEPASGSAELIRTRPAGVNMPQLDLRLVLAPEPGGLPARGALQLKALRLEEHPTMTATPPCAGTLFAVEPDGRLGDDRERFAAALRQHGFALLSLAGNSQARETIQRYKAEVSAFFDAPAARERRQLLTQLVAFPFDLPKQLRAFAPYFKARSK